MNGFGTYPAIFEIFKQADAGEVLLVIVGLEWCFANNEANSKDEKFYGKHFGLDKHI